MLITISIITIVVALFIVGFIVIRKFPQLTAIDLSSLPKEKQKKVKTDIIEQRVVRKVNDVVGGFASFFRPFFYKILAIFKNWYQHILNLEKYYKERSKKVKFDQDKKEDVSSLSLDDRTKTAEEMLAKDQLVEAEQVFIDIISHDPKNVRAYYGLAQVYFKQKDLEHSEATYEHILKLEPEQSFAYAGLAKIALEKNQTEEALKGFEKAIILPGARIDNYIDLGKLYEKLSENEKALETYKIAATKEPNNPKILDLLLEASILNKKRVLAKNTFNKLKKTNPENNKLEDFKRRIEGI